ncbi:hypothetical protein [Paraburkholderia youngii]|uniref:hypothetical protein n=1 Tax=Paraburkholderia youngii TaxID=2782701 RepID=UPI003D23A0BB
METSNESSLDEMFAQRERLNQAIAARLDAHRQQDHGWEKQNDAKALERYFPDNVGAFLRVSRLFGFAVVFHDGTLEAGHSSGRSVEDSVRALVEYAFPDRSGFSERFRAALAHEFLSTRIFDASAGFAQFSATAHCKADEELVGVIENLCHLIEWADTKPGGWNQCRHENGHAICKVPEHEHKAESWRNLFGTHDFMCHDMHQRNVALAVAAVNALPQLIETARDGLKYRARVLVTAR